MGFRATLNFRKFKVALNSMYRNFLNFAKSCILSCLSKFYNKKKKFTMPFLKYRRLKLKVRVLLAGHSVVTKIIPTYSPVIGQFFDNMIVASIKELLKNYDPSKSASRKVLKTVLSHLKCYQHPPFLKFVP